MSKPKDPPKVVVRLLPPEITEEELLQTIPEVLLQRARWRSFVQGKRYKGEAKPALNSRCYFQFEAQESADEFIREYHGHQFVDGRGEPFRAVACFAPYQKVPKSKSVKDPRDGTIFDDPEYKEFLEALAKPPAPFEAPPDPKAALRPEDPGDTPLLQFLKSKAKERRARMEKRERERRRWQSSLDYVEEEPKRAKWRCAECGTAKNLEEDPDDRGTFYCTYCWEYWEGQAAAPTKAKKKKKKKAAEEEEYYEEETSKRKKKKDKEKEAAEEWWTQDSKASTGYYEEDGEWKKKKKKKKSKDEEGGEEAEASYSASSGHWKAKDGGEDYYGKGYGKESYRSKSKKSSSYDEWWSEATEEKPKKEKKAGKYDKYEASGSSWWSKDGAEEAEKPRRSRRDRDEGSASHWVPKVPAKS